MITVAKDGKGDFTSINEALKSIKQGPETVFIKKGIYYECVEVTVPDITLIGEDAEHTIITYDNYANMIMEDGSKRGTFRSYTFLVHTDRFTARNITIENSAGFGCDVGQAIALYCEGDMNCFYDCRLLGHQDTLFTGPLPPSVKIPGGFVGPTEFAPRVNGRQYYENCFISGEVDFIFGSATAYFKNCTLYALDRSKPINSFITAPSTPQGQTYGYVFDGCTITGNCPEGTVMLSRPWRDYAKAVFLNCNISEQVNPVGYDDWNKPQTHTTAYYGEYNCTGPGANMEQRLPFIHKLTDEEALTYSYDKVMHSR